MRCQPNICDVEQIINATDCAAGGGVVKYPGLDLMDCAENVPRGGNCTVTCGTGYSAALKIYKCVIDYETELQA
jgi:hypothetical protein